MLDYHISIFKAFVDGVKEVVSFVFILFLFFIRFNNGVIILFDFPQLFFYAEDLTLFMKVLFQRDGALDHGGEFLEFILVDFGVAVGTDSGVRVSLEVEYLELHVLPHIVMGIDRLHHLLFDRNEGMDQLFHCHRNIFEVEEVKLFD